MECDTSSNYVVNLVNEYGLYETELVDVPKMVNPEVQSWASHF